MFPEIVLLVKSFYLLTENKLAGISSIFSMGLMLSRKKVKRREIVLRL